MNKTDEMLDFQFPTKTQSIIKVVGVGGGGGNAVNHMYNEGIHDVSFALCNTDNQALSLSPIATKIQLGRRTTEGLGAGNKPDIAALAAEESYEEIKEMFSDGTKMTFITAGMGGGTGTGAAPIVAKTAKDLGILTVGIVTIPFLFEGKKKIFQALKGVSKMAKNVDALLVINNQRLIQIFSDLTVKNGFAKADDTLTIAAKGISEIITVPGIMNLDFADVKTILKDGGVAIMSTGKAEGEGRLEKAIDAALRSPLLNNNNVFKAEKILFNVYTSDENQLLIEEMEAMQEFTQKFGSEVEVIWGIAVDDSLKDGLKVTLLASGYGMEAIDENFEIIDENELAELEEKKKAEDEERRRLLEQMKEHYGESAIEGLGIEKGVFIPQPLILSDEEMNNDRIIEALENVPAYKRDKTFDPLDYSRNSNLAQKKDLFD